MAAQSEPARAMWLSRHQAVHQARRRANSPCDRNPLTDDLSTTTCCPQKNTSAYVRRRTYSPSQYNTRCSGIRDPRQSTPATVFDTRADVRTHTLVLSTTLCTNSLITAQGTGTTRCPVSTHTPRSCTTSYQLFHTKRFPRCTGARNTHERVLACRLNTYADALAHAHTKHPVVHEQLPSLPHKHS